MIKNIAIVSLSRGVAGEAFAQHEVEIGLKRLAGYGVNVQFMPNALRGIDYLTAHPEARAADLLQAFRDPGIDMILCAIGGDDTYRLLPYLFDHDELRRAVTGKVFLGFSDTTVNHMMLHKVGLPTFYGQAFLPDVCELGPAMLPYTERYFAELLRTGTIREVTPSDVWYESRTDFSPSQIGIAPAAHPDDGFQLCRAVLHFPGKFSAAALTHSTISLMVRDMQICRSSAENTTFSPRLRTGRAKFCCWKPARSGCRQKNTARL